MKHKPDFEMEIMRRGLRDLAGLTPAGRARVLAYWTARAEAIPELISDGAGEQQLDIEELPPPLSAARRQEKARA